jgi:SAM-dependent methyltransferase
MCEELYKSGRYLQKQPDWHIGESPWKAREVRRMLVRNSITPKTICDVGCGAGEVLKLLQQQMDNDCIFWGYEIAPPAIELCKTKANERLQFKLLDIREEEQVYFDLILVMDVVEHLEDYFSFLRAVQPKSLYKIFQFPMDLSIRSVLHGYLIQYRDLYGHLHYFTKETALRTLQDTGYEVLDYFYTSESIVTVGEQAHKAVRNPLKYLRRLLGKVRRGIPAKFLQLLFAISEDLAVRLTGRWRLIILAK